MCIRMQIDCSNVAHFTTSVSVAIIDTTAENHEMTKFPAIRNVLERSLACLPSFGKEVALGAELVVGLCELTQALTLPLGVAVLVMACIGFLVALMRKISRALIAKPAVLALASTTPARSFSVRRLPSCGPRHRPLRSVSRRHVLPQITPRVQASRDFDRMA